MIAIIGAMDEEIKEVELLMSEEKKISINNINFITGKLSGYEIVLMKSGVGKVHAAVSCTVLFTNFDIDCVINVGTAGGLKEFESELDVVVSTKVAYHDVFAPDWERSFNGPMSYVASSALVSIVESIIESNTDSNVWVGPMVSGDCFVSDKEDIDKIIKYFPEALCADMEAGAIAQCCKHFDKPFIVIRSLSDITIKDDNDLTFEEYITKASKQSAKWCKLFVEQYYS